MDLRQWKSVALDVAVGFACLCVMVMVAIVIHNISNLTLFLLFGMTLFFLAGLLRTAFSNANPWLKGIVMSLGASIPVLVVGWVVFASATSPLLWGFIVLVAVVCGAGAQTYKFWKGIHRLAGVSTVLFAIALVIVVGKVIVPRLLASSENQIVDKPAPDVTLAMLNGAPVSLASLRGRVVVLDFWGTWCAPCVAEMPALGQIYSRFENNQDVVFLVVNSEWNDDTPDKIRSFVQKRHLNIPVALDTSNAANKLDAASLPSLILIDRRGHIRMEKSGYDESDQLQQKLTEQIDRLLKTN